MIGLGTKPRDGGMTLAPVLQTVDFFAPRADSQRRGSRSLVCTVPVLGWLVETVALSCRPPLRGRPPVLDRRLVTRYWLLTTDYFGCGRRPRQATYLSAAGMRRDAVHRRSAHKMVAAPDAVLPRCLLSCDYHQCLGRNDTGCGAVGNTGPIAGGSRRSRSAHAFHARRDGGGWTPAEVELDG